MATLYKLTDETGRTQNDTQWGENVTHKAKRGEGELGSEYYLHAYEHPLLAVLLNPIHMNFKKPRLWEAEGRISKRDHGLKVGCKTLTTVKEIDLPVVTKNQRIRFAILCALDVYEDEKFAKWADGWLSGEDRSEAAAGAAAWAAEAAAGAAAEAAEAAARAAARSAAEAAARAAWAAAGSAAWAAGAAAWAAEAAALGWAASAAEAAQKLINLAEQAIKEIN